MNLAPLAARSLRADTETPVSCPARSQLVATAPLLSCLPSNTRTGLRERRDLLRRERGGSRECGAAPLCSIRCDRIVSTMRLAIALAAALAAGAPAAAETWLPVGPAGGDVRSVSIDPR